MWSGIAALGVLLLGLLIYVKACEKPIEGFSPATETELLAIAEEVLGDTPANVNWSGETTFVADEDVLSDFEQEAADAILDQQPFPTRLSNDLIEVAVGDAMSHNTFSKGYGSPLNLRMHMAYARTFAVLSDQGLFMLVTGFPSRATSEAVGTATSVDEWMQAQAARMLFLQAMSVSLEYDGWTDETKAEVLSILETPSHRAALGRVLHRRFIEQRIPEIAEASNATDMAQTAADALIDDPTDDETKLISALLKRHTRAFSPEATAESGAESVRQIVAALQGPWASSQTVLDRVVSGQSAWSTLFDVLNADEALAIIQIKHLKEQIDSLENPVGIAILHRDRTGWANLVQSAYVADAQEALFKIALLRASGKDDEASKVLDPLTGEPYDLTGISIRSKATDIADPYGFLKAFAKANHPL